MVFAQVPVAHDLEQAVMDKGYDSNQIRDKLQAEGITPVIPPKNNRKDVIEYDKDTYKLREKVERFSID